MTEKSTGLKDAHNQYVLCVEKTANKQVIAQAVEKMFKVSVEKVCTMVYRGKNKRVGRHAGKLSNWKKAVITLKAGDEIEMGQMPVQAAPEA